MNVRKIAVFGLVAMILAGGLGLFAPQAAEAGKFNSWGEYQCSLIRFKNSYNQITTVTVFIRYAYPTNQHPYGQHHQGDLNRLAAMKQHYARTGLAWMSDERIPQRDVAFRDSLEWQR